MRVTADAGPLIHLARAGQAQADWFHRRQPRRPEVVVALSTFLGRGEAEAIALAADRTDTLLLIDEGQGRRIARELGISIKGTLGLLLDGHHAGRVSDLADAIGRMRDRGTWIADDVVAAILRAARRR